MDYIKYFLLGIILGFVFGFTLMNIPDIMKGSATYKNLQKQQIIERRK